MLASAVVCPHLADANVSITAASGGASIPADRAANAPTPAWTSLGTLTIAETGNNNDDMGGGTLVLKAPEGFEFNTNVTPNATFTASRDITATLVEVTDPTTITITIEVRASLTARDALNIGTVSASRIQVRPVLGTPLATGSIYRPTVGGGTAVIAGVSATTDAKGASGTSFGNLAVVAGALDRFTFETPPPATVFANMPFSPAPAVQLFDQFGNLRSGDNSSVVRALRKTGTSVLTGTNATASAGIATFSSLTCDRPGFISLTFSNSAVTLDSAEIEIVVPGLLFYDDFARTNEPGTSAPWLVKSGAWRTSVGRLLGGTNSLNSYGFAYLTNAWTNYTFEAQVQLPANAFGAGIGGRLDPVSGGHYAAWIYPENSSGGSNLVRLLKFGDWGSFTTLAQASVASVGTATHDLKVVFQNERLAVYFDGVRVISTVDPVASPYLTGAPLMGFWTAASGYETAFDEALALNYSGSAPANDAYGTTSGATLSVPAPGVLANDLAAGTNVTAVLVTPPAQGTLNLSSNGAFTYTAPVSFSGAASFTYRVNDGLANSGTATVTINVTPNSRPTALSDSYSVQQNTALSVPAPGVLGNDSDPNPQNLRAVLAGGPSSGTLTLNTNGGLLYIPLPGFSGNATFTYTASDGLTNSTTATVTIAVTAASTLFSDNFTRTNDPGSISPWVVKSGLWTVTGGALVSGTNSSNTYGQAYTTNNWSDYTVEAQVRYSPGAFGGGLGGRLTPATGAHYAAWIYPEGSPAGSNVLWLLKFQNWNDFTTMAQARLGAVGTNAHALKLAFVDNGIGVYYDGKLVLTATDPELQHYETGGALLAMWTAASGYRMTADNVTVLPWTGPRATNDIFNVPAGSTFSNAAPGVLVNDLVAGINAGAVLVAAPARGSFALNYNGSFTYTPTNFAGSDTFTYRATDGVSTSATATVTLNVQANQRPVAAADSYSMVQSSTLTVPAPGVLTNDSDPEGSPLSAVTNSSPTAGTLTLSSNGGFVFTPPAGFTGAATFTYLARDGATNSTAATVTINITTNGSPVAAADAFDTPGNTVLRVGAPGVLANDSDPESQPLVAFLAAAPASGLLTFSSNGGFTYYPDPAFSGNVTFSYRATDLVATSAPVNVTISVGAVSQPLFSDDFTRAGDPGALAPWVTRSGNWLVSGGLLAVGTNTSSSYGYLRTTNGWVDYAVEARVRFTPGAFGGGVGGRLDPISGAHYAAWIYPAGSPSGSNVMRLFKFQNWDSFASMAQANLPDVGTNWHTLKLVFQTNQIAVSFDGSPAITKLDTEPQVYPGGNVSLDMWTDSTGYRIYYDDVTITPLAGASQPGSLGIQVRPAGGFIITYTGDPGAQTVLETATSLAAPINWTPLVTNTADPQGNWTYTNNPSTQSLKFYRSRSQ